MVAPDLGDRTAEHDEEVVGLGVGVEAAADLGSSKDRVGRAAVECGVQLVLDGRADQQRILRVVGAEVNLRVFGRAERVEGQCDVDQWGDVRHADQAEADAFA